MTVVGCNFEHEFCVFALHFFVSSVDIYRSVKSHDDDTIATSQSMGIVYESFDALKGCPTDDSDVMSIAKNHNVSVYQVCRGALFFYANDAFFLIYTTVEWQIVIP